jgi:hypothetical protein
LYGANGLCANKLRISWKNFKKIWFLTHPFFFVVCLLNENKLLTKCLIHETQILFSLMLLHGFGDFGACSKGDNEFSASEAGNSISGDN